MAEAASGSTSRLARGRCRCGHFPTQHMVTRPIAGSASFRLEIDGPCAICGESGCRAYAPAGPGGPSA